MTAFLLCLRKSLACWSTSKWQDWTWPEKKAEVQSWTKANVPLSYPAPVLPKRLNTTSKGSDKVSKMFPNRWPGSGDSAFKSVCLVFREPSDTARTLIYQILKLLAPMVPFMLQFQSYHGKKKQHHQTFGCAAALSWENRETGMYASIELSLSASADE